MLGLQGVRQRLPRLNGLDDDETWRKVGVLFGERWTKARRQSRVPLQQTVTTACHHCVEPACLERLPGARLRQGPRHRHRPPPRRPVHRLPVLRDEVPVRSAEIFRPSAALCASATCARAASRSAKRPLVCRPARARPSASPDRMEAVRGSHAAPPRQSLLGSARSRSHARPPRATNPAVYIPPSLLGGFARRDIVTGRTAHWPLVFMLVLTQAAVGAEWLHFQRTGEVGCCSPPSWCRCAGAPRHRERLHLGRPLKAWRVCLGWRTVWFSREIIAFALAFWPPPRPSPFGSPAAGSLPAMADSTWLALEISVALAGLAGRDLFRDDLRGYRP